MAGVARNDDTLSNLSGNTYLLTSGDESDLNAYVESHRGNTPNTVSEEPETSRPATYAAAAAHRRNGDDNSANRHVYYRNEQYLTKFEQTHFDKDNVTPERPCTAYFHSDTFESSDAVFNAITTQGINPRAIRCLQKKPSGDMLISFSTPEIKKEFVRNNAIPVEGRIHAINDGDRRLTYLNIYDAPYELSDLAIIHRLESFCEVIHSRRGKYPTNGIFNGNRHYRVRIHQAIPSYLRFGKFLLRLSHDGQDHTCRRCNRVGHFANECPNTFCFNCEGLGHMAKECPGPELCCICKSPDHRARYCRYSWHRSSPPHLPVIIPPLDHAVNKWTLTLSPLPS